jgi:hypothetical protein
MGGIVDLSRVKPDPSRAVFSALADLRVFEQARIELGAVTDIRAAFHKW